MADESNEFEIEIDHRFWLNHCDLWRREVDNWVEDCSTALKHLESCQQQLLAHRGSLEEHLVNVDKYEALINVIWAVDRTHATV